ncbi:MAG: hypothetical protein HOC74_14510, partial [Gemmatimonadetes bacterium]|nr:hypothetical protein [Gemmatimonadota bacterium]
KLDAPATRQREIRSLQEAAQEYPQAGLHVIILDVGATRDLPGKIALHAASKWLLGR